MKLYTSLASAAVLGLALVALPLSANAGKKKAATNPTVLIETSMGNITLELNAAKAPKTVANFLSYVKAGHYNGTIFHRVINDFMVQGGGFDTKMKQKPAKSTVMNEADNGLTNDDGTVAMARTGDPHSASAQFFINVKANTFLNHRGKNRAGWGYAVFGKVTKGMDVVRKIKAVKTGRTAGFSDVPVTPVVMKKVKLLK